MLTESVNNDNPSVLPVVPMKPLSQCKTRLERIMGPQDREDLTIGMLRRVLLAIRGAGVDPFWVIGGDDRIRNLSRTLGAVWMEDLGRNLNDTITKAFESARLREVSALYLPGDLPFIRPADIHQLIRSAQHQHNVTLSPARRDGGTNAILVPYDLIPYFRPELGSNSFRKHVGTAARMGVSVAFYYSGGMGFDLDDGSDLDEYEHMEPGLLERLMGRRPGDINRTPLQL
ncbi:MAG: 2-phospho-L-lactate guanylyltransferase [Chloroflexi bacterium]|nr:2-phospho-L-lactate guanylyltransferase [Chloroflexota bacterium]